MGDIAEYYYDSLIESEFELEARAKEIIDSYKKNKLVWKTKTGEKILISDMTNSHIKNSINFLERKENVYRDPCTTAFIDVLKMELKKRISIKSLNNMTYKERVHNFRTKNKEGFVQSEIKDLLKEYPHINMDKFNNALVGSTCMIIDDEIVIYHCDVEKALLCGIENRNLNSWEWD